MVYIKIINFCCLFLLIFCGCSEDNSKYLSGYAQGTNGKDRPSGPWASKEELQGYQDGLHDGLMYDQGYEDGMKGKSIKHHREEMYMLGYKEGKKYR